MCLKQKKKITQFYVTLYFTVFLTIILQDMLKFSMNFQKSVELNNKTCLQQGS